MYLVKGVYDPYNERGEYRAIELHFTNRHKAEENAQRFDRALVLDLRKPVGAYGFKIVYEKGYSGRAPNLY